MPETPDPLEEFPRQVARTRGFSLGVPRAFTVSPDGERVVYLRTKTGDDPVSCLWVFEVSGAKERLVFDPGEEEAERDLTEAERARRERARERSSGVTSYATDEAVRRAVFTVAGRMFLADLVEGSARELSAPGSVDDPRLDRSGERIAFVVDGTLYVREIEGGVRELASPDAPDTYWGLAEFIAAEEMERYRGHWWSPDASKLAATHVDEREVLTWFISDPTDPAAEPRAVRYPQAGTNNAVVTLWVFDLESGERVEVTWDHERFPYLARVDWSEGSPLTLLVQTRDQRTVRLLEADASTGVDARRGRADRPPVGRADRGRAGASGRRSRGRRGGGCGGRHVPADRGRRARDAAGSAGPGRAVRRRGRAVPSFRRRPDRDPPVALDPRGRPGRGCPRSPGCIRAPRAAGRSSGSRRRPTA